jgi:serine phosphatase RsbU (regulator of sigma subunit)
MASDAPTRVMPAPPPAPFHPLRTLPGRLLVLSGISLLVVWLLGAFLDPLPPVIEAFRKVASFAIRVAILWLLVVAFVRYRQQFLWAVRRKLILSYVFLGFVPVVLLVVFGSVGAAILHSNTAAYVFNERIEDLQAEMQYVASSAAAEIGLAPVRSEVVISGQYKQLVKKYRGLSLAVIPASSAAAGGAQPVRAGAWLHTAPPSQMPLWAQDKDFIGLLAMIFDGSNGTPGKRLLIRASVRLPDASHVVIVDLPVDAEVIASIDEATGARLAGIEINASGGDTANPAQPMRVPAPVVPDSDEESAEVEGFTMLRRTVMFKDFKDWNTGLNGRVTLSLEAPIGRLLKGLSDAQGLSIQGGQFLPVLIALGVLLLIVQGVALFFGASLGRQITSAVHELFEGTERVQQGDFTHRIPIESKDQLGELAGSFNQMTGSIEHLLHVQREKQRLDDELRIARDIQQSLLPVAPPAFSGVTVADLCVPAREVGGDYYDFFQLGPRQFGVLVADVSGKGTSAALYMAELKGLMLALSQLERSPKALLCRVNRLLADHLDNRSFITATYAVIDLEARTMTHARAGHTPLIVASASGVEVIVSEGMVLGLRLPGAAPKFESLLEEHTRPLNEGDVIVLYTDGITEAMDEAGDLFNDASLSRVVGAHHGLDAIGIRERVLREVKAFVGDAEPHDDMTMVVIKVGDLS